MRNVQSIAQNKRNKRNTTTSLRLDLPLPSAALQLSADAPTGAHQPASAHSTVQDPALRTGWIPHHTMHLSVHWLRSVKTKTKYESTELQEHPCKLTLASPHLRGLWRLCGETHNEIRTNSHANPTNLSIDQPTFSLPCLDPPRCTTSPTNLQQNHRCEPRTHKNPNSKRSTHPIGQRALRNPWSSGVKAEHAHVPYEMRSRPGRTLSCPDSHQNSATSPHDCQSQPHSPATESQQKRHTTGTPNPTTQTAADADASHLN